MAKKDKFIIFDVFTGKFVDDMPEETDFEEFIAIAEAEKEIALKMIKQKLNKIDHTDYEESTD